MGTAVTYTAAGIIAGATGDQLQAYFQNVWAIGILSSILIVMSMSMFGLFELQMPSFIQSRVQHHSLALRGGPFIRTFIMGVLSSLIVGACVSPLLITLLGLAIRAGDPVLGGAIMFSMAMGMGVILVGIGIGAGFILPRAGSWMDTVKHVFGVLLLGVAIYLLGVLPQVPVLLLWAALFIIIGVYMGATQTIPEGSSGWRYLWKGAGTFLIIWGSLALIGGLYGNRDVLQPLPELNLAATQANVAVSSPGPVTESGKGLFAKVENNSELDKQLEDARAQGKPVLIDFYATWCTDCLRMERGTFSDPRVQDQLLNRFVAIKIDVTDPLEPQGKAIKQRFSIFGPPAMLFFDASGKPRDDLNFYGYRTADDFLAILDQV
jgi:thiol:disulfide interchange protein DsbD